MSTRNKSTEFKKGIKAFIQHVESLESSDNGFINEYVMIQEAQMRDQRHSSGSMDIGKLEPNLKKNRYKDIVPYDDYRIVLGQFQEDECSDYINASKIMGVNGTLDYIAAQGPLSWTVDDFWRMLWEYDVEIVFMACRLVEMNKIKCSQYWADVGNSKEFGNITVLTVSEQEIFAECIQRTFRVTSGNDVRNVTQLHYCGWPDHGIPENPDDIRDTIGIMRSARQNLKAPVLVHCSAGCGRTGTIIAIDFVWTLLENGKFDESFSLFDLICNLRKQRVSLVQTPDQYALVNKVLKSLCKEMLAKIASHTYENVQFDQELSNDEGKNQQRKKEPSYHGSKKEPRNIVVSSTVETKAPEQPTPIDSSHPSTNTQRNFQTLQRSPRDRPKASSLKTSTPPLLPTSTKSFTEQSSKTLPRSSLTAESFGERRPQTQLESLFSKEKLTLSSSKTLTPQSLSASTKSFTDQSLKAVQQRSLSNAESTAERHSRSIPQPSLSNHSTADEIRQHFLPKASLFSPAHAQKPPENIDKPITNRKWSSVKSRRTSTQTRDSPHYENVVLSIQSGRLIVPTRSTSVKVSAGNKVYDFSRQSDSRRAVVKTGQGIRGMNSNTTSSEIPTPKQTMANPGRKLQDVPNEKSPASPKFKGYVLLTQGDRPSGEGRGNHHT